MRVFMDVWAILAVNSMTIFAFYRLSRNASANLTLHRLVKYAHKRVLRLRWILYHGYAPTVKFVFAAVLLNVLMLLTIYHLWLQIDVLELLLLTHVLFKFYASAELTLRHFSNGRFFFL